MALELAVLVRVEVDVSVVVVVIGLIIAEAGNMVVVIGDDDMELVDDVLVEVLVLVLDIMRLVALVIFKDLHVSGHNKATTSCSRHISNSIVSQPKPYRATPSVDWSCA
jgi:hypothetical protein